METLRSERLTSAGGLLFTVLAFLGHDIVAGESAPPAMQAPAAAIATYVAGHPITVQVWVGWYLELLGFLAFLFFLGSLWSILQRAEGVRAPLSAVAFGGGLLAIGVKVVSAVSVIAAYSRAQEAFDAQLVAALIDMGNVAFVLTLALWAVFLIPTATVVIRTGVLPRWLGWAAAVLAPALLVGVALPTSSFASIPWLLYLLWVPTTSIAVLRGSRSTVVRAASATAAA